MTTNHTGGSRSANLQLVTVDEHEPSEAEVREILKQVREVKAGRASLVTVSPNAREPSRLFIKAYKHHRA